MVTQNNKTKQFLSIIFLFLSLVPIYLIGISAYDDLTITPAELLRHSKGAAIEDIVGFGYWPYLSMLSVVEAGLLGTTWFLLKQSKQRYILLGPIIGFIVVSVFGYLGYERVFEILVSR